MTAKQMLLEKLARLAAAYRPENPFAMSATAEQEWDRLLEQAEQDCAIWGATDEEISAARGPP
jgi:hypothetical protein